jgi:hypothetical protein
MRRSLTVILVIALILHSTISTPQECVTLTGKSNLECITQDILAQISFSGLPVASDGKLYSLDFSLSAMVFSQIGRIDISRHICDTLLQLQESDGKIRTAYDKTTLTPVNNDVYTTELSLNALALARMFVITGDNQYLNGATHILDYIQNNLFDGACFSGGTNADPLHLEQNVVVYSAAQFISSIGDNNNKYLSMMNSAKQCLDTPRNVQYTSDNLKQTLIKTNIWYGLAIDENEQRVIKNADLLGAEISKGVSVNAELHAATAIALHKYNKDNTFYMQKALDLTMPISSIQNR